MFQTAPGVTIPYPKKIKEEYQLFPKAVMANISYEKLHPLVQEFYQELEEPLFFVLQIPLSRKEEEEFSDGEFHQKVMYLDGLTKRQVAGIFNRYGEVLLQDGMSQFAVASHRSKEEIFVQKYKLTEIYAPDPQKYLPLLKRYGLTASEEMTTVWNTFSRESPGECRRVTVSGMDCYTVAEALEKQGMYVAKIIAG